MYQGVVPCRTGTEIIVLLVLQFFKEKTIDLVYTCI